MSKEFKGLNIKREEIIPSINKFCSIYFNSYLVDKEFIQKGGTRHRLQIKADEKSFYMDFHLNLDGTTTIEDFGGNEVDIKKELAKFIKEKCQFKDNCSNKWFVANDIEKEDFDAIVEILEESEFYDKTIKKSEIKDGWIFQCRSKYNEKLTINYYYSKKVVIQGRPLFLFNEAITMISELIDPAEIPKAFNDCYEINIDKDDVITQYEIKMPNSYDKHSLKLKKVLLQAVYNTNIKGNMFEYSCLPFPALRALEGHLKYIYIANSVIIGKNPIGSIFYKNNSRFYMKEEYSSQIRTTEELNYIENAYNYYHSQRHTLFHWGDVECAYDIDETRVIENYGQAINLINDILKLIDNYFLIENRSLI
ncbi:Uncharacterised protein [[Clostridium] sordellii]|uniref:type II toxin-antitoxin system RnlA family toxin n=1 Tax=Paraclostridium sordellii TaxID=1505 RepID=UPI0005E24ED4|nr:type II toxin-antitoxin system RnlA family toxin [Paeniclostridium sordellii]CEQ21549.1 Uncharacterised protein [[Clostridium] sordellii] [Paeniclostridium sordellii]